MDEDSPIASLEFDGVQYAPTPAGLANLAAATARVDGPKTVVVHSDPAAEIWPGCACDEDRPCAIHPLALPLSEDRRVGGRLGIRETYDRARCVRSILERCHAELLALQCMPHLTADDVNELGAAKGFAERAVLALGKLPL